MKKKIKNDKRRHDGMIGDILLLPTSPEPRASAGSESEKELDKR